MQALMPMVHTNKSPWQYHLVIKFFNTAMSASTQDDRRQEQLSVSGLYGTRIISISKRYSSGGSMRDDPFHQTDILFCSVMILK